MISIIKFNADGTVVIYLDVTITTDDKNFIIINLDIISFEFIFKRQIDSHSAQYQLSQWKNQNKNKIVFHHINDFWHTIH